MNKRSLSGLLLVILAAVAGYLLISLPPRIIDMYRRAAELGPAWGYAYLAAVAVGLTLMIGAAAWIGIVLWRNTRRKRRRRERRERDPGQLSRDDQERELEENLAESRAMAEDRAVSPEVREAIEENVRTVASRQESQTLQIVAFGTISSGKSSLLNALAGRDVFRTEVTGGTTLSRSEIPWPGADRVELVDTPGLAEVRGEDRAGLAAKAARDADLVLFVVDGPLKNYEVDLLRSLGEMSKRVVVCLNKEDWYGQEERDRLMAQIGSQVARWVDRRDVVAVRSRPVKRRRVRVLPDGSESEELVAVEPDIRPLAERMMAIVQRDGRDLLLANLLLKSRGLVEEAKRSVQQSLDKRADEIIRRYMWAAGSAAAINPIPLVDLAGGSAISVKMVLDLARVYRQEVDVDTVVTLLGQLGKNLIAMLGATAATPAAAAVVASMLKTVPGIGTIAGGFLQGIVQALVTRWIGKVFCEYFRNEMKRPPGGLAELAREKWEEITRPEELRKLVRAGRERLDVEE
ncbi:MAG: DUF697 domain-containing protein [Pirellulales bacterium]